MKAKYVNPYTDFGFKKLFGEEASKPLLVDFLNALLPEINIINLAFKDKEQLPQTDDDRKAICDIYCENNKGEKIIIELQKAKQNYFRDRMVYYSTFPIQEQAQKGNWNYKLESIYCIGILDFIFEEDALEREVVHTIQLKDQLNKVFYNKLKFVYLEMPYFDKNESELKTKLDKWLYFIKNLEDLEAIPSVFKEEIFVQAFEKAAIANYSYSELVNYEQSLKQYRDLKGVIETAFDEGKVEGIIEGIIEGEIKGKIEKSFEIAKKMILKGMTNKEIVEITELSISEIEQLRLK